MLKQKYLLLSLVMVLLPLILFIGCKPKNPTENLDIIADQGIPPVSATISLDFKDAASQLQISNTNVTIKINGTTPVDISDGSPMTGQLKSFKGMFVFSLLENISFPIEFVVVAEAPGYIATSLPITISKKAAYSFTINMVNLSNLPEGVASNSANGSANSSGILQSDLTVEVTEPNTSANASLALNSGTKITDANGNPLQGSLKAEVVYFNNQNQEALRSFPGGFMTNVADSGKGLFYTGGFASFDITDGSGRRAKNFDQPAKVVIQAPKNTKLPNTSTSLISGRKIPVFSYNPESGQWREEAQATLVEDGNGNFNAEFEADHLSWWNLDWFYGDYCYEGIKINVKGNFSNLTLQAKRVSDGSYFWYSGYVTASDPTVTILNAPRNVPVVIEAVSCGSVVGTVTVNDLCAAEVDLTVNDPTAPENIYVKISGYCPDEENLKIRPTIPIWIFDNCAGGWRYAGYMINGEISVSGIVLGNTYTIGVWYNNQWAQTDVTITQTAYIYDIEIPASYCD